MHYILTYVGIATTAFIVIMGWWSYRSSSREMKALFFYFVFDLIASICTVILARYRLNNLWFIHLQLPVEYGFFVWAISGWTATDRIRKICRFSIPVFFMLWIISLLTIEDFYSFNMVTRPVLTVVVLSLAVSVLLHTLKDTAHLVLLRPRFWICAGLIIYQAGNAILFLFTNVMLNLSPNTLKTAWILHGVVGVITYFLYAGGFICQRIRPNSGGR